MNLQLIALLLIASAFAFGNENAKTFRALHDPLADMIPRGGSGYHRMPMRRRSAELSKMYHNVHVAIATIAQLDDDAVQIELTASDSVDGPLLVVQCTPGRRSMMSDDFRVSVMKSRGRHTRATPTAKQMRKLRQCECSGHVVGEEGSVVEVTLCGRLS